MSLGAIQNNFTNYYKHLSEFCDYVEKLGAERDAEGAPILNIDSRKLHRLLFKGAHEGRYGLNDEIVKSFEYSFNKFFNLIINFCDEAKAKNPYEMLRELFGCRKELEGLFDGLILGFKAGYAVDLEKVVIFMLLDTGEEFSVPKDLKILFSDTSKIYKQIYSIMAFDTEYDPKNQQKNKIYGLVKEVSALDHIITLNTNELIKGDFSVSVGSLQNFKEKLSFL